MGCGTQVTNIEKMYLIRGDGGTIDLTDLVDFKVLQGVDGRWMPTFDYASEPRFRHRGEVVRNTKVKPRDVTIPIMAMAGSGGTTNLLSKLRLLNAALSNDIRGTMKLKCVARDGEIRMLPVRYSEGMGFQETPESGTWDVGFKFPLRFIAHSPYWFDPLENEIFMDNVPGETGSGNVNDRISVLNKGDVITWPVWSLTGRFDEVTLQNMTTGDSIDFYDEIPSGQRVYIDTREDNSGIMRNHFTDVTGKMSITSVPFELIPGKNDIMATFDNEDYSTAWRCRWVNWYNGV